MDFSRARLEALTLALGASLVACSNEGEPAAGGSGGSSVLGTGGGTATAGNTGAGGGSNGCGVSGVAPGVQNLQITVNSQVRTYVVSIPSNYSASTPQVLVFAFHGMGGSGTIARQYFNLEVSNGRGGYTNDRAIFVYPDGLANDGGSTGWSFTTTSADMAFFDALFAEIMTKYCIDTNRVFVTGHSMGGMATNALGCYRGDLIRAIAPVAGMPPMSYGGGTVTCAGNVGAFVVHGSNDATVDFTRGGIATRDFWLARNGCSTTTVQDPTTPNVCVDYQGCQPDLPVIWCVHTLGHDWPNTTNCDGGVCFTAGPAIWSFFSSFGP